MTEGTLHRRERFILGCSLALGVGVTLVPQWATNNLWPPYADPTSLVASIRDAVIIIFSSGFVLGTVVAVSDLDPLV